MGDGGRPGRPRAGRRDWRKRGGRQPCSPCACYTARQVQPARTLKEREKPAPVLPQLPERRQRAHFPSTPAEPPVSCGMPVAPRPLPITAGHPHAPRLTIAAGHAGPPIGVSWVGSGADAHRRVRHAIMVGAVAHSHSPFGIRGSTPPAQVPGWGSLPSWWMHMQLWGQRWLAGAPPGGRQAGAPS